MSSRTMTFIKTFLERSVLTFIGIAIARTIMPDERLNRLLGRTPDVDHSQEGGTKQSKDDPLPPAQRKPLSRPE
jgi:hypothetical protein